VGALADIIRRHGPAYVQKFGNRMPPPHRKVLRDLVRCRTPDAGGQLWHCPKCGQAHPACHSCGNRHCPTCGGDDARLWLNRQLAIQLPVTYFLCTCTLPKELRQPVASMPRELLPLLFQSSSSALMDLCLNLKWFGAIPGITGMLHTWARSMIYHPHIHYLVTGGGFDSSGVWRWPKDGFLVPAPALSRVFRERFKAGLKQIAPEIFASIPAKVWQTDWVVDIENVGNGSNTLKYLARYIYRVALTDSAILHHDDRSVTFRYRHSDTGKSDKMNLPVFEFLHRFLQHVLPKGFVKVRYFGLHHPAHRKTLSLAKAALYLHLKQPIPPPPPPAPEKPLPSCPKCKTPMIPGLRFLPGELPPSHAPPSQL
jgi:hypothetical protein